MIDPRDGEAVQRAFAVWLAERHPAATIVGDAEPATDGMSTFVWFLTLAPAGRPDGWPAEVVLRVFPRADHAAAAGREATVMEQVALAGYPSPTPLARATEPGDNPLGLPFVVLERVPGRPLLKEISAGPWRLPGFVGDLARLAVRLHALPVPSPDTLPLPRTPALVDRWLTKVRTDAAGNATVGALLDRLEDRAGLVRSEEPVLCHGDFHPLNVLSRRVGRTWEHVVIDWTDAAVGDRHFDVSRTLALFSIAAIAAQSKTERTVLRAVGPGMRRSYRHTYERGHPLDPVRLRFWEAAHLVRGVHQMHELAAGATSGTAAAQAIDPALAEWLQTRASRILDRLSNA